VGRYHDGAAHDVTCAAEHFGQARADDIAGGEDIGVTAADGVVDNEDEVVETRKTMEAGEIGGLQEGVTGEFGEEGIETIA